MVPKERHVMNEETPPDLGVSVGEEVGTGESLG